MQEAKLHPTPQVWLAAPGGHRVQLGLLFVSERVAVDIEGYTWHGSRLAARRRPPALQWPPGMADIRAVLRFEAVTVFRAPDHMVRVIRRALARGAQP